MRAIALDPENCRARPIGRSSARCRRHEARAAAASARVSLKRLQEARNGALDSRGGRSQSRKLRAIGNKREMVASSIFLGKNQSRKDRHSSFDAGVECLAAQKSEESPVLCARTDYGSLNPKPKAKILIALIVTAITTCCDFFSHGPKP
jgi:hypothetical protein